MKTRILVSAVVFAFTLVGCGEMPVKTDGGSGGGTAAGGGNVAAKNIVEVAQGDARFSTLVSAVIKADLATALSAASADGLTVFAPTNDAFAALEADLKTKLGISGLGDLTPAQLKPILLYHVLNKKVDAAAATTAATAMMKIPFASGAGLGDLGGSIQLKFEAGKIKIDDRATVVEPDVMASNGVIHAIDKVLLPSIADIAVADGRFKLLVAAAGLADTDASKPDLVKTLDTDSASVTVFAPIDAAFVALVDGLKGSDDGAKTGIAKLTDFAPYQVIPVLKYHLAPGVVLSKAITATATKVSTQGGKVSVVIDGGKAKIDKAEVLVADLVASNGIVHAISKVMLPSITDVATTSAAFSELAKAIEATDAVAATSPKLASTLDGDGPGTFTVFTPINAAVAALPAAATTPGQGLTNVILLHALGSTVYASDALKLDATGKMFDTANTGKQINVSTGGTPKGVLVKGAGNTAAAKVILTNVFTSNGVIHAVDTVLLP
jgi:transforming growth factor-beta-induced protein